MHIFSTLEQLFKNKPDTSNKSIVNKNINSKTKQKVETNNCYVLFIKDGDTFVGMHNNEKKIFRLAGIDTPEKGEKNYIEATHFLKKLIYKKIVYLDFVGEDIYNRFIVEVYSDREKKININEMLIKENLATSERYKNNKGEYTHDSLEYLKHEVQEKIATVFKKNVNEPLSVKLTEKPINKKRFPK